MPDKARRRATTAGQDQERDQTNLEAVLARLDFSYPPLKPVKELIDQGNKTAAFARLIEHFRERKQPTYLFEMSDARTFHDEETVQEADRTLRHEILGHQFGKEIDWHFNATNESSRDSEWTWSLARHGYWVPLARAYVMTGNEAYVAEFVTQMMSFVASWPVEPHIARLEANMEYPGDAWRSIEAAIRIYAVWLPVMELVRRSPSLGEQGWACFLKAVHDHAEFLRTHYSNHRRCSNWLTMECSALFQLGVMFPEFVASSQWKQLGYRRFTHEVRYQFDHDGVHIERTPIYHLVSAISFLQAYRLATLNGIPVPPYMLPILERSAEFLMILVKPDMTLPMIGDADRVSLTGRKADSSPYEGMNLSTDPTDLNELRAFFATMAKLTHREDFLYLATGRQSGKAPLQTSFALHGPGYYVFRTGWGERDSYFLVTGTAVERGSNSAHSHRDAGHLELHVDGEDVLIDTGRYLYGNCAWTDWWQYFATTAAHNTVQVDEHRMGEVPDASVEVRGVRSFCHRFDASAAVDLVELSHNGYAFMEEPIFHLRRVFHFKPGVWIVDDVLTGIGHHRYRLYFNFAPGELRPQADDLAYKYSGKRVRIACTPLLTKGLSSGVLTESIDPKGGWVSYAYSLKQPTPQLVFEREGVPPMRFLTALTKEGAFARLESCSGEQEAKVILGSGGQSWRLGLGADSFTIDPM